MKKSKILYSLVLATTCLVSTAALAKKGGHWGDTSKDSEKSRKSKFNVRAEREKLASLRLSDKGDLPCFTTADGDNFVPVASNRRRFYTKGDGDCFFWATDQNRQDAVALWLQYSSNEQVRRIAAAEIYDELLSDFNNERALPAAMQANPLYKDFRDAWIAVKRDLKNPDVVAADKPRLIQAQDDLMALINLACIENENLYRDYVTHCLSYRHEFMLSARMAGGVDPTYFVDALAHIRNKNLVVWGPRGVAAGQGGKLDSLVKVHEFITNPDLETWEVYLHNGHYSRIVPVNDKPALAHGLARETAYILESSSALRTKQKEQTAKKINLLNLDYHKAAAASDLFPQAEKANHRKKVADLQANLRNQWGVTVDNKTKAAYYNALHSIDSKKARTVQETIDQIEAMNAQGLVHAQAQELPGLRNELNELNAKINFYTNKINQTNVHSTEAEIHEVLVQLFLHYGEVANETQVRREKKNIPAAEQAKAAQDHQEALKFKNMFGEAVADEERAQQPPVVPQPGAAQPAPEAAEPPKVNVQKKATVKKLSKKEQRREARKLRKENKAKRAKHQKKVKPPKKVKPSKKAKPAKVRIKHRKRVKR